MNHVRTTRAVTQIRASGSQGDPGVFGIEIGVPFQTTFETQPVAF